MKIQQKPSRAIHICLWLAQIILSFTLLWAGVMKLSTSMEDLSAMWPWTAQIPVALVKVTGIVDVLGALGLLLPSVLRIKPILTPIAAMGILILMICASTFHVLRGEVSSIGVNIVCAFIAVFIAWGRFKKVIIMPKQM